MVNQFPQVLTIAGSDCDGSAGMQADMNTFQRCGVYGMSVLTAAVAGNSYGIFASQPMPTAFIDKQFSVLADDFEIKACKTGMLTDAQTIKTVAKNYQKYDFGPLVLDPVIITKHGDMLLEEQAYETLKSDLIPLADVLTPNYYEAVKLTGVEIKTPADALKAAHILQEMGAKNVYVKGQHADDKQEEVTDVALLADGTSFSLSEAYVDTTHINGTGDLLSSCIVAQIAQGKALTDAFKIAKKFVTAAIANQIDVGHKFGPVNHLVDFKF
ncbi:phosphomethylpyrimidine kinase [Ligilactobacillus salitolerans]|uniref:Hydroxymethylpyrimidine/phosphomethylpyrimidine kinase n=1 Tax=Ligilactobacillus salitolerans TaxID=1808352 RepID=A0A401ISE3_9LACO|nr:bifunctional hydroxymethylpyrimidine kinase/phosphomethylpyrimidine kinase [Ligilactobacillus salitolerans]GBG94434.1 phosphomethylpyrimidine kinase [Ligilactobacillus salitolerans]